MRVLALDYGAARCGTAISDPTGTIASPLAVIERPGSKRAMKQLRELVQEREVGRVLVGLPLSLNGQETPQTAEARLFAERLRQRLGQTPPVELYDERLTTRQAARSARDLARAGLAGGPRTAEDSRAAAHLLEAWLSAQGG